MMKNNLMNPLRGLALFAVVIGLVFTTSCGEDEDPGCTEVEWFADTDGDGLGDATASVMACEQPEGYVDNSDDEDDTQGEPTSNIWELVESTDGLDSLEKYLNVYPDLVATLEAEGTFTLFAPDNNAFISLLATPGFPSNISSINPDIIKNVLAYHVSTTQYLAADLTAGSEVATASQGNEKIVVNSDGTLLTGSSNSAIEITSADKKATNGVMHVVGSVMIPPTVGATLTPILGTNAGTLLLGAPFSVLAQAIQKADAFAEENSLTTLVSILSGETTHTVFAPTNATFAAAADAQEGIGDGDGTGTDAEVQAFIDALSGQSLYGMIANHVVLDEVLDTDLTTGATLTTAFTLDGQTYGSLTIFNNTEAIPAQNGVGIYIDGNGDVDLADQSTYGNFDAEVAVPNAAVNPNGRVHVIAGILSPQ